MSKRPIRAYDTKGLLQLLAPGARPNLQMLTGRKFPGAIAAVLLVSLLATMPGTALACPQCFAVQTPVASRHHIALSPHDHCAGAATAGTPAIFNIACERHVPACGAPLKPQAKALVTGAPILPGIIQLSAAADILISSPPPQNGARERAAVYVSPGASVLRI